MMDFTSKTERNIISVISAVGLLVIWKLVSIRIGTEIILPPPEVVFFRLVSIMRGTEFWGAVGATVIRTVYGLVISFILGFAAGIACGSSNMIDAFLSPVISVTRTVPVMSIILLAMIWFKTDMVPVFVCVLMIFPILTANVRQGVRGVDRKLVEVGSVYRLSKFEILRNITIPSVIPFVLAGLSSSIGVGWKVVIAAEVLSQPLKAIGTGLQFSQMNLETAEVMAWTIVAVFLSWLTESLLNLLIVRFKFEAADV